MKASQISDLTCPTPRALWNATSTPGSIGKITSEKSGYRKLPLAGRELDRGNAAKEKARLRAGLTCLTNCRGRYNIDADRPAVHYRSSRGRRNIHRQGRHSRSLGHSRSSHYCRRPYLTRQRLRQRQSQRLYQSHGPLPVQLPLFQLPRRLRVSV
jgi:hypothetical protein